jgi:hypothetical protein
MKKKYVVDSHGYMLLYMPDHPRSFNDERRSGYMFEHIYIAEHFLGRSLLENEVVHHLDLNPLNNRIENLLVIDRGMHNRLHAWLGKQGVERTDFDHKTSIRSCAKCGKDFLSLNHTTKFCSHLCSHSFVRTDSIPDKEELSLLLWEIPTTAIAKKYNVSDSAVGKWCKKYNLEKPPRGYWRKLETVR